MRLLFDQNLSDRLVEFLADLYPESNHVRRVGLSRSSDDEVWSFAAAQGYVLVSKDSDFHQFSMVRGDPPKVIWIRTGNSSTVPIAELIRLHADDLNALLALPDKTFLALG